MARIQEHEGQRGVTRVMLAAEAVVEMQHKILRLRLTGEGRDSPITIPIKNKQVIGE